MRKIMILACAGVLAISLMLTGCKSESVIAEKSPAASTPAATIKVSASPTPSSIIVPSPSVVSPSPTQPTATPAPAYTYAASDTKIIRTNKNNGEKSQIYDAKKYYPADTEIISIRAPQEDNDALYFLEYGGTHDAEGDDTTSKHSIIRINKDGSDRKVLVSEGPPGIREFFLFHERIFYIADGYDSMAPKDVGIDGSGKNELWDAYAKEHGVSGMCINAIMHMDGDRLYVEADFFVSAEDDSIQKHVIEIDGNMNMTAISIGK